MNKWLLGFLLFFQSTTFAQIEIQGRILDKDTQEPMPFTFLVKKRTGTGAITNEDGYFSLNCLPSDTLRISFVGYETRDVSVDYFLSQSIFYLPPKISELNTVVVYGDADINPYLAVLKRAKQKLKASEPYQSKTYFTLESNYNDRPLELLECYYNAQLYNQGVQSLSLKNGRVGIAELDNNYFVSLSTSRVIEQFSLLFNNADFPSSPLHFPTRKLLQLFDIKLITLTDDLFALEFQPIKTNKKLFSAKVWVDRNLENLLKVEMWQNDLTKHPFIEIDSNHTLDCLNFTLAATFDNSERQMLNKIEIKYDFDYDNRFNQRHIETEGVFLFYEKDTSFNLPYHSFGKKPLSDYDKIVGQPYNPLFWEYNEVLSPSQKVLATKAFFEDNGVLLNFSKLAPYNPIFNRKIQSWNPDRLRQVDLNGSKNYQLSPDRLEFHQDKLIRTELFEFVYGIYLDRNQISDRVFYTASALFDLKESFYYLKSNRYTDCLINIAFDMVEIEKRAMITTLESDDWAVHQVDSIYFIAVNNAVSKVNQFIKDTEHGKKELEMLQYINEIDTALAIDNRRIIGLSSGEYEDSIRNYYATEVLNISNALLELGKYEIALNVLKVGENFGDIHPWVYNKLGVCYVGLKKMDLACKNFKKAEKKGEAIEKEFSDICQ